MSLGGSITNGSGATTGFSWRELMPSHFISKIMSPRELTYVNAAVGGTSSFYSLIRLQTDVIAYNPNFVFIEEAVNDYELDLSSSARANKALPASEALIRLLLTALPQAQLTIIVFTWPNNYSHFDSNRRATRDKWLALAAYYGIKLLRWDTYLETLLPVSYVDADVEQYLLASGDVHPNNAGHLAAYNLIQSSITGISPSPGLPVTPYYADVADWMNTPITRNGTDNDGETGGHWSTVSTTARQSSTANDTISWAGTMTAFGLDSNFGAGAGTFAYSVDGAAYSGNIDLSTYGQTYQIWRSFDRGAHTITIKVISGTVKINRFLAL